jgi:hypothetical protein
MRRLVDMAETEREVIATDFLRTKVKATHGSIDERPGIGSTWTAAWAPAR